MFSSNNSTISNISFVAFNRSNIPKNTLNCLMIGPIRYNLFSVLILMFIIGVMFNKYNNTIIQLINSSFIVSSLVGCINCPIPTTVILFQLIMHSLVYFAYRIGKSFIKIKKM
jgi:hypothetical protein